MIGWRETHTLKDYLVRAKITNKDTEESKSVTVNVASFVSISKRQVTLKTLIGISTIFVKELHIATQILLFTNFIVAVILNKMYEAI